MNQPLFHRTRFTIPFFLLLAIFVWAVGGASHRAQAATRLDTVPQEGQHTIQGQTMTDETTPRPVQNAVIIAKRISTGEEISTTTGVDGNYSLNVPLAIATWSVRTERGDSTLPAQAMAPGASKLAAFTSNRTPQTRTADFTFAVASSHISGRVLVKDTTDPPGIPVTVTALRIGNAGVSAASVDEVDAVIISQDIDPATGAFDLVVPAGVYQMTIMPSDVTQFLPLIPLPVTVADGETHAMGDLFLIPVDIGNKATIAGHVQTPAGDPAQGVQVAAINLEDHKAVMPQDVDNAGAFSFAVDPGTWWVTVALGADDPYMPYRTDWQTTLTVEAKQVISDVVLLVAPADAVIHGTLTQGEGGPQASDACGLVAAYKKGEPNIYDFRTFTGGAFDLPVITGTYRLLVTPDPGVAWLEPFLPDGCTPGKYMATTERSVDVSDAGTASVTIALPVNTATIHGQLWDRSLDQAVPDTGGQLLGWNPALHTYAMAKIDDTTGRADLRSAEGDWLLAFHVDPNSGYKERPAVATATVGVGVTDVDVHLNVVKAAAVVTGTVLDPDGAPVPRVIVSALGAPGGDSAVTDKDGQFTLSLNYGVYVVEVFGPAEIKVDQPWISPAPVKLLLREGEAPPSLTLQYRSGDAAIHGRVALSGTQSAGATASAPTRAVVWAASQGARTRSEVTIPMAINDEYRLPVLMGQEWLVTAAYWDGTQLWTVRQKINVDSADIALDLTLVPVSQNPAVLRISQAIDTAKALYAELSDGVKLHVPAGALGGQGRAALAQLRKTINLYRDDSLLLNGDIPGYDPCCNMRENLHSVATNPFPPIPLLDLISPAYTLGMVDRTGNPLTDNVIRGPMILRIPYGTSQRAGSKAQIPGAIVALKNVQAPVTAGSTRSASATSPASGWEPVANYIVDETNQEVVIFVEQWGSYALGEVTVPEQVFLPLTVR